MKLTNFVSKNIHFEIFKIVSRLNQYCAYRPLTRDSFIQLAEIYQVQVHGRNRWPFLGFSKGKKPC